MKGFIIKGTDKKGAPLIIHFKYHKKEAPQTVAAFDALLPFEETFLHARVSGQEVWTDKSPVIDVPQENASVFTKPGEVVIGPKNPKRVKTANCMGIYYGEGQGLDAANIFAKAVAEDMASLEELGKAIWKKGGQVLRFEKMEE